MSIQSEIERISANIAGAYSALSAKGAALPSEQNSANLANTVGSIPTATAMTVEQVRAICT